MKKVIKGEYHAWDELNKKYKAQIDQRRFDFILKFGGTELSLCFEGKQNPCRLAEFYKSLPGVSYIEPWIQPLSATLIKKSLCWS